MRFRRFAQLAAIVAVCTFAVSACNSGPPEGGTIDGDGETTTTTATPTASPTKSPTPTADPTADTTDEQVFVRNFVGVLNDATAGGDTKPLRALCTADSESCTRAAKSIDDIYKAGGSFTGGPIYRISEWALKPTGDKPVKLQALVEWNNYTYVIKKGEKPKSAKAGSVIYEFHLLREGNGWKVQEYFTFE